jgi:2-amino-4-hydroxy-6-hydroxymethyldihydropteridine diphosphokinase
VLDIDLLLAVGVALHDRGIELPHPELSARRFVLEPLLEVDRDLVLPDGTRLEDSLSALGDQQRVERIGELHAEART